MKEKAMEYFVRVLATLPVRCRLFWAAVTTLPLRRRPRFRVPSQARVDCRNPCAPGTSSATTSHPQENTMSRLAAPASRVFVPLMVAVSLLTLSSCDDDELHPIDISGFWPNSDDLYWEYTATQTTTQGERNGVFQYTLNGSVALPGGGSAQLLTMTSVGFGPGEFPRIFHGGGFKKTDTEIGVWDTTGVDGGRLFVWLVAGKAIGESFETSVLFDGNLTGVMAGFETVEVPAGRFVDCLRVEYRLLRSQPCTCSGPDVEPDNCDVEHIGTIHFAEGVGPVMVQETTSVVIRCPDEEEVRNVVAETALRLTSAHEHP